MSNPKHILILADGFGAPAYTPRLRSLCDYLVGEGHRIDVVVEHIADLPFEHAYPIDEVHLYNGSQIDWAVKNVRSLLTDWKNRAMSKYVERRYGQKKYDAVFCTTFHTFPLRAAVEFGARHHIPVTLDLRDIVEQAPHNQQNYLLHGRGGLKMFIGLFTRINLRRRNHWLRLADHVTTVSPWHVETLRHYNPNTHLIYNGYDASRYQWQEVKADEFILSYTGKYFGLPLQDASLLFEALADLRDEIPYRMVVHSNPDGMNRLRDLAQQSGIADRVSIAGYIPNEEAIRLYHESSILLIFSNLASDKTVHGMMTTKFFEALGVEKPVLCVRSDEEVLADAIRKTHAGLAATRKEDIMAFIRTKYTEWKEKGYTRTCIEGKEMFDRKNEAKQIEEIVSPSRHEVGMK